MLDSCFWQFSESIETIDLPSRFTYPFDYEPHELCRIAACQLQQYLLHQSDWQHDFGIDHYVDGINIGKMFGVLVVRNSQGELGFLAGFSGKLAGTQILPKFVPPIVDLLSPHSFYRNGEAEIEMISEKIHEIECSFDYQSVKQAYREAEATRLEKIIEHKQRMNQAKISRDIIREQEKERLCKEDYDILLQELRVESTLQHYKTKEFVAYWNEYVDAAKNVLQSTETQIEELRNARKELSNNLQKNMFSHYTFLNALGESKSVCDIFHEIGQSIPPSGAGDCAAPKLLQYAYLHAYTPVSMAEFWWGQSPKSQIRKHAYFYPSCRTKCEPILGHMLQGLQVDEKPLHSSFDTSFSLEIIYEDADIVIVNKPANLLSVPGKGDAESVFSLLQQRYEDTCEIFMVHRLDMSTSGLLIAAKHIAAYHDLQDQFAARTVKKRYVALLDGIITDTEGCIDLPLRVDLDNRPRQLVCFSYGKPAITFWKVVDRSESTTRIHFFPHTGRTHQLRVHAAHYMGLGCSIVGDDLYGKRAERLYLHAESIEFVHPNSKQAMHFVVSADF